MTFKPLSNPLLIVSDNPALPTGLARQSRDIACLAATLPQFRVGFMGRGIGNRRNFPFTLYDYPESGQWGEGYIQQVWEDFSDGRFGIILTCDDLSRRHWMVNPAGLPDSLAGFIRNAPRLYRSWSYVPVDGTGPDGTMLPLAIRDCAARYNRVLAASEWGCKVLKAGGRTDADWLPHGIFMDKFHPIPNAAATLDWGKNIVVGCVMANQSRKDYPAAFECFRTLCNHYGPRFRAWLHVDTLVRYWNVYALAADYGIGDQLEVTLDLNDDQLALRYSTCACTILPSGGEGFGYPIAESLACGTPCVVTGYGAGPELVSEDARLNPVAYRVDTQHNILRAVLSGYAFAQKAIPLIDGKLGEWEYQSDRYADSVAHLDWGKLKHLWVRWLLEGLK